MKIIGQNNRSKFKNPCDNLFLSPEWLRVISNTYHITFKAVLNEQSGFILPFCELKTGFFPAIKSIPFGDYTLNECDENDLNEAMHLLYCEYPEHYIETSVVSKHKPIVEYFFSNKYGYLIQNDIKQWKESRDRKEAYERNIRNALNYGLAVRVNKFIDGINNFYLLHEKLRISKFKKLPQPIRFFENIYAEFVTKNNGFFLEAWDKDKLIASWFVLAYQQVLYYKFGASDTEQLHMRSNDLLFRMLMQYGSDKGFKKIDLGFSGATKSYEGLIRFKRKEGGNQVPIYRVERFPDHFDKKLLDKRNNYINNLSKKAIESGDLSVIRETSNQFYGDFA